MKYIVEHNGFKYDTGLIDSQVVIDKARRLLREENGAPLAKEYMDNYWKDLEFIDKVRTILECYDEFLSKGNKL